MGDPDPGDSNFDGCSRGWQLFEHGYDQERGEEAGEACCATGAERKEEELKEQGVGTGILVWIDVEKQWDHVLAGTSMGQPGEVGEGLMMVWI